jgi:UDP-GlcNAc3NAcA epimerase
MVKEAVQLSSKSSILDDLQLKPKSYILFTMHRAENINYEHSLILVIRAFEILSKVKEGEIVFPIHSRTKNILKEKNLYDRLKECKNVELIQPVSYIDFIKLMQNAKKIITDSGGSQKEAYLLAVSCITIRKNTERVETVNNGWNLLTGIDTKKIVEAIRDWMPLPTNSQFLEMAKRL